MGYFEARKERYENITKLIKSIAETLETQGFEVYYDTKSKNVNSFLFHNKETKQIDFFSFSDVPYRWCVGRHKTLSANATKEDILNEVYNSSKMSETYNLKAYNDTLNKFNWILTSETYKR